MTSALRLALIGWLVLLSTAFASAAEPPATIRVDYYHSGNAEHEMFSLHQVVIEPLPWPGNPDKTIDTLNRGHFLYRVEDPESGAVLFSRGFSSIFQEWQSTGEAKKINRTFHESVRFPDPGKPVLLGVQTLEPAWASVNRTPWEARRSRLGVGILDSGLLLPRSP